MNSSVIAFATAILALAMAQSSASAQESGEPSNSFGELLEQLQEDRDSDSSQPGLPDIPSVPAPKTAPVFPEPVGPDKPLPWTGLRASPAFQKTSTGVRHELSSLVCNDDVAGFELGTVEQVSALGESVSCSYRTAEGTPALTIVMYTRTPGKTSAGQLENLRTARMNRNPDLRELSSDTSTVSIGDKQLPCENSRLEESTPSGPEKKTFSICELGSWRMLFSLGPDAHNTSSSASDFVEQFVASQRSADQKADQCSAFGTVLASQEPSGATGISYHAEGFNYTERGEGCYAGHTSSETGSVIIRVWPNNPDTPITLDYVSTDGQFQAVPSFRIQDMWASVAEEDRGPAGYLLMREQADGTITVYSGYTRIPTDGRVYEDAAKAYRGETDAIMLAKQNPGGGWTMMAQ
ncbi:MAG: hypothetical protein ABJG15_14090 [Hyphomonadaceae bacterium]